MDALSELINICRNTDSDKVTERKKQVDKLKLLLAKPHIVKALHTCSDAKLKDGKEKKFFGWDSLFKVAKNLVLRESDAIQKAKDSQSTASRKKKQEICDLLKLVIKLANKGGKRLRASDVVNHVINIMKDDFTRKIFGADHTSILLKGVLSVRAYWNHLDSKTWHEVLNLYCSMLMDAPPGVDRVVIARVIHSAIEGATQQCDLRTKKLLSKLEEYFKTIREEKSPTVTENILSAVNTLCEAQAIDGRVQICRFGELVFVHLLHIWNSRPSESLKEEMIRFYQLQMTIHHPHGALDTAHGAFAVDWDLWKSNRRKLYEAVYTDLETIRNRTMFSSSSKDQAKLPEYFVTLATDLCHQLFVERTSVIDVTQLSTTLGGPTKKRRIESGWGLLRDAVSQNAGSYSAVPWLQLLGNLVKKYPTSVPDDEFLSIMGTLQQVYVDSKKPEVTKHAICSLVAMAVAQVLLGNELSHQTVEICREIWQKIWIATLRIISLHHAESEGFHLLSVLLENHLVTPERDIWSLYLPTIQKPSQAAVKFLQTYLSNLDLPERFRPRSLVSIDAESVYTEKFPLRRQLLQWIFPAMDSDLEEGHVKVTAEVVHPKTLARVLVNLTLREPSSIVDDSEGNSNDSFTRIAEVYLVTSFDKPSTSTCAEVRGRKVQKAPSCISHLQSALFGLLKEESRELLEVSETEVNHVESIICQACLISEVMKALVQSRVISTDSLPKCSLYGVLKKLLERFAVLFADVIAKEQSSKISPTLHALKDLFDWKLYEDGTPTEWKSISQTLATMMRKLIPSRLINMLLDVALDKIKRKKSSAWSSDPGSSRSFSRGPSNISVFDDFDSDFNGAISQDDDLDDIDSSRLELQESSQGSAQEQATGSESLLAESQLSATEQSRLQVVDVLAKFCSFNTHTSGENNNVRSHDGEDITGSVDPGFVSSRVIELLDSEENAWDASKAFDLQLLRRITRGFCSDRNISDCEIQTIQDALRSVCLTHRKSQEICRVVLELLAVLVPHLASSDEMVPKALKESRKVAMHLHRAFWKMMLDRQFVHGTRTAIAECMRAFIESDPDNQWTRIECPRPDNESSTLTIREQFPTLLEDRHQAIRLLATREIHCLFNKSVGGIVVPLSSGHQDIAFETIYTVLQGAVTIEGRFSPDEQRDEIINRTSSVMHVLANISCSSTVCEKKALFALSQMTKDNKLDMDLVQKVLSHVANQHGYKSSTDYIANHIPYVLNEWQESGYKIPEFPYQMTGLKQQADFYKAHISRIVPLLVMWKDTESLEALQTLLDCEWQQLVMESIPQILVHILPYFAAAKATETASQKFMQKRLTRAKASYDYLTQIIEHSVIERSIISNFEEIVVQLLMTFWDSGNEQEDELELLRRCPEPNPPCYNQQAIEAMMDYLTQGLATQAKTLISHLSKTSGSIQQILLALSVRLSGARCVPEKYRLLLGYKLFAQLLLDEFGGQLGGSWAFVLQDIIYTLLHTIQATPIELCLPGSFENAVVCLSVRLLYSVCQVGVECCSQEMGRFLPVIICTLVSMAKLPDEVGLQCVNVINYLIVVSHKELGVFIRNLDPLPDTAQLTGANRIRTKLKYAGGRFSLKEEVEHFLQASEATSGSAMHQQHETLKFFHKILSNDKEAVSHMTQETQENAICTNMVRFVYKLVKLTKSSDKQEAELAGKCLGEIGPLYIPIIAVKEVTENSCLHVALHVYKDDSKLRQYCWVFHTLSDYLKDPSIDTVVAAGNVLKQTLATKTGISFYTQYKNRIQDHLFQYLFPFRSSKKVASSNNVSALTTEGMRRSLDRDDLWTLANTDHSHWLCHLVPTLITSGLVSDDILKLLAPICEVKVDFCHKILPFIIHDMLMHASEACYDILNKQINQFFRTACQGSKRSAIQSQESVKTMLSVVLYLRQQEKAVAGRRHSTSWDNNFWLDFDYLAIAQAAHNCGSHFTALLFSEIWCDIQREKLRQQNTNVGDTYTDSQTTRSSQGGTSAADTVQTFTQGSQLETLSSLPNDSDLSVQCLMLEAYRCVGDSDAMYGCGAGRLADTVSRIKTYQQEGSWTKALGSYDLEMGQNTPGGVVEPQLGLLQALQNCGCSHVLDVYLRGLKPQSLEGDVSIKDLQFEAAWRNTNWTIDVPTRMESGLTFNQALYTCMSALKDKDIQVAAEAIQIARQESLAEVSLSSLECTRNIYPTMCQLHCVTQAEDILTFVEKQASVTDLLEKWQSQDALLKNDFTVIEPILSQRCILLEVAETQATQRAEVLRSQINLWEQLAKKAREANRMQIAERAIHKLRYLDSQHADGQMLGWRVEEAWMFWSRGECDTAKHLIKSLIKKLEKLQDQNAEALALYPKCLGIYGNWLAETRSENPNIVMEQYLKKATDLLEASNTEDEAALDAFLSLGRFADGQYQNIVNYMKSSTYEAKQELVIKAKQDAGHLREIGDKNSRYLRILEKQRLIDEQELLSLQEDRNRFLNCALQNYLKCLQGGDKHDLRVFRLTSLWFDNSTSKDVNKQIKHGLPKVKSQKFLSLMYQLAARMSRTPQNPGDLFQPTLDKLIERTVLDHPHHTLPIILALANANKDTEMMQARGSRKSTGKLARGGSEAGQEETEEDRVLAAKAMVERLMSSKRADIIRDMNSLCLAYIQMANWSVDKYKKETRPINIPTALAITQMKTLVNVAVPTLETKVDPSCEYKDIIYVKSFQPTFKLAGGINLPKIISCVGSDGVSRRQLVKGKDDLRQDAVMQQVFSMVNNLLYKDPETRKRQLTIRTYKVIPLSQRSGLLEWCEGTIPMGDYLIASQTGAHEKYRPQDMRAKECRLEMNEAHTDGTMKAKFSAFLKVCHKFKPVFRHFFMENFPDPSDWYKRRLAYTHSVATNSIVGYILGLGDRHVQNILIDTKTAEMVHIDLGVAFEQGRILPTPETVPFRLTRDVVDGMGIAGVEGVFRRCCEKTMEVMRGSHEALLTILQVLLYDPLYAWTISPEKAYMLQHRREQEGAAEGNATRDIFDIDEPANKGENTESVNRVAERVLLRLQQKLQGVEDGVPLSVSGQVNLLIQQARDPKNLCKLFPGWQPYI